MKNYNWQVIGHHKIIKFLQKNITNKKLSHAYLFSGKNHLGKNLVAQQFINTILCSDYNEKNSNINNYPCGSCIFCNQLNKGIHPDVYYLKKEEDKKNITVEQVREMQKILYMASFLNSYKIALIAKAEDLSESAQNALLKILEEPKKKTILILLTSDYNLLLPTIVSRCQLIKFYPLAAKSIYDHLISLGATRQNGNTMTALSHGYIGLAIDYYKNPELFELYIESSNLFLNIINENLSGKFKIINDLLLGFENNMDISSFLNEEFNLWQLILRDILFIKNNSENLITNFYFKQKLTEIARRFTELKLINLISEINKTKRYLANNINPRLAVENLLLNF